MTKLFTFMIAVACFTTGVANATQQSDTAQSYFYCVLHLKNLGPEELETLHARQQPGADIDQKLSALFAAADNSCQTEWLAFKVSLAGLSTEAAKHRTEKVAQLTRDGFFEHYRTLAAQFDRQKP